MTTPRSRAALPALLLALLSVSCEKKAPPASMPPPEVSVVKVIEKDVPLTGEWVATLDGYVNAQIQPQVAGYLVKQNYREGSAVRQGDVLFEIDPRPFQAALDLAQGQLAQARGQLAQASVQLDLAEINVKRDTPLAAATAIPQSQLDTDLQARAQAQALVQTARAAIESARANVEQAQLNLGFTHVRSLIDGVAGIAQTQIGNLVSPSATLTTVSQVNPIKAYFPISEQEYLQVARSLAPGGDWLRAGTRIPLRLTLADGSLFPHPGRIVFVDRQVDSQTGAIRVVGAFPNPGNLLRPGQFGRVSAVTGTARRALLVPQRSVSELQGRYQVALVGAGNKVSIRTVTTGSRIGPLWIISSGLQPGDLVISEGVSKVRDGATVNPTPGPAPDSP